MYAAIIATWTQAVITAMTIPAPIGLRLREPESARRKDVVPAAIPAEATLRPDMRARHEHGHQRQAVVLAFPRGGVTATQPNADA
jgi:hypothetical protein